MQGEVEIPISLMRVPLARLLPSLLYQVLKFSTGANTNVMGAVRRPKVTADYPSVWCSSLDPVTSRVVVAGEAVAEVSLASCGSVRSVWVLNRRV